MLDKNECYLKIEGCLVQEEDLCHACEENYQKYQKKCHKKPVCLVQKCEECEENNKNQCLICSWGFYK